MITRVLIEDNVYTTANKIFNEFKVGQSCAVWGTVRVKNIETGRDELVEKGKAVLNQLEEFDRLTNTVDCGRRRKKERLPNSIGGPLAQKIFIFKRSIENEDIKWTIWRRQ